MQAAFMQAGVSESHFVATTGYGYGDRGRDVLDEVYARASVRRTRCAAIILSAARIRLP